MLWFPAAIAAWVKNRGKVQNDICLTIIYEFNIYLFFKKMGKVIIGRAPVRRNMLTQQNSLLLLVALTEIPHTNIMICLAAFVLFDVVWLAWSKLCDSCEGPDQRLVNYVQFRLGIQCHWGTGGTVCQKKHITSLIQWTEHNRLLSLIVSKYLIKVSPGFYKCTYIILLN